MARREAIRALQTRLAERLQAARAEGASMAWLAVRCGERNYLLPLSQSGEIHSAAGLQGVPYTRAWFLGVLNIRGGLFGVVDLNGFEASDRGVAPVRTQSTQASVVTFNPALDVNCALWVDALLGLRGTDAFTASQASDEASPPYWGSVYTDAAGLRWQEIDLRALTRVPAFLNIRA